MVQHMEVRPALECRWPVSVERTEDFCREFNVLRSYSDARMKPYTHVPS